MRLRNDPKAREYLNNSPYLLKQFPIILNSNVVLEIGMGKGEMLCEMALKNPNITFIGIEKFPTVAAKAAKRFNEYNLKNIYIVCEDIEKISDKFNGFINEIWLTFSDPWPKKKHFKRRLTYNKFLDIYRSLLDKKGILKIKTDNDQFFKWSFEHISEYPQATIIYYSNDLHNSIKNKSNILTGYEKKWSSQGKNINYMEVQFKN